MEATPINFMKALYLTANGPTPSLSQKEKCIEVFNRFAIRCFIKDPSMRPDAETLLMDPSIAMHRLMERENSAFILRI